MTSIDKMSIRGIRSFSPADMQVIEFFKPLTLIVGKNGSGKTTIIESLKMCTTGELPPNCKSGQAFINDPNVYGTNEVKAQIKLKFTSALNKPAVCQRSFSLTQKPQRREYKAFEAALQTLDEHNQKTCLSYKCADLNKLVPEMMGVSTAVLESVIFVHQEDSCWPLGEDRLLKQKFDDIFAATSFTKALDAIKALKLEKSKDIRALAAELETCETKLATANRLREELAQAQATKEKLVKGISDAGATVGAAREKAAQVKMQLEQRDKVDGEYQRTLAEHHHALDAADKAAEQINVQFGGPLSESDEELREIETKQRSAMSTLEMELDTVKRKVLEVEKDIERAETNRDGAKSLLEQEKAQEAHDKRVEADAMELIESLDRKYSIAQSGFVPGASAAAHAQDAVDRLARVLAGRQKELARAKDERQATTTEQGARVQQQRIELEHSVEAASTKEREAASLSSKQRQLQEKADASGTLGDESTLMRLRHEVSDLKGQVAMVQEELESSQLAEEIATDKVRRRNVKDKLAQLQEELTGIERESDKQQRLQRHQQNADEKRAKLDAAINERRSKLAVLLDVPHAEDVMRMLEHDSLSRELYRKKQQREEEVTNKERDLARAAGKMQKKDQEVFAKSEHLRSLDAQVAANEEEIRAIDPLMLQDSYDFNARIAALEKEQEKKMEAKSEMKQIFGVMKKAYEKAEAQHVCLICSQKLSTDAKAAIKERYTKSKRNHDEIEAGGSSQLDVEYNAAAEATRKHKHAHEVAERNKRQKLGEIPAARETLEKLKSEQNELKQQHQMLQEEVASLKERAEKARDLQRDVDHLRYVFKEWSDAHGEVASIQSGMQSGMHSCMRAKEQVLSEREEALKELDHLEKRIEHNGIELDRQKSDCSETKARLSAKELELNKLSSAIEKKAEMDSQVAEMREQIHRLQAEAQRIRDNERPAHQALALAEAQLKQEQTRHDHIVRDLDAAVTECVTDHTRLSDFASRLAQAGSAQRRQLMEDCESRCRDAEKQVLDKRAELKEKHHKQTMLNNRIQGQDKLRIQMHANIQYRDLRKTERGLHTRVDALKAQLEEIEPAARQAANELRAAQETISKTEMSRAKFEGSLATVEANIKTHSDQLKDKAYRRIDQEHREKLIEHKTVQMAVNDLNNYYKAFNSALMRFHENKMADINKSITELWNKTYKGTDIDGIQIKTEDEGQTADGRRKTAYRVVMRKGDTTLDMRGRCSAGQKVLASLVIRLALAETFCINCGILALDEPTTNLDRANIESLGQAINEIIRSRKQQSNFQLIVITHDEDFVQMIGRSENTSHYFHVEKRFLKEGDPPASTITKHAIERFG